MKKIIASGVPLLLAGGYCASLSAACQMVSGKTIEYSVNVSQASINLDVSDLPIGSLLYSYGGMIITNNERWEIACSGSEPGGFQSIGGSRVGPAGDGKPGDIYSIDRLPGIGYSFQMGNRMALISIPCSRPGLPRRYFPASAHFRRKIKNRPSISGGLPITAVYRRRANIALMITLAIFILAEYRRCASASADSVFRSNHPPARLLTTVKTLTSSSDGITKPHLPGSTAPPPRFLLTST
ncbi:hypothetical protein LNO08_06350 [Klebsiella pneumoniae subsp. pneumoniae]|nr:hypothetical protein [Klebsiella pneumoniae subsp. pneumoniae]